MHRILIAAVAALLALPAAASAHVTIQPKQQPAGGFTVINVRVPNETEDADTTKVRVQMPDGFESASYQQVPGWKVKVAKAGNQVSEITFSGGKIAPGQFQDFPLSVKMPEADAGTALTFKALQTYSDGEVVRWIGAPDSEKPAPQITLTAAAEEGAATTPAETATPGTAPVNDDAAAVADDDEDGNGLAVLALIIGILGLLAGLGGLAAGRRARAVTA